MNSLTASSKMDAIEALTTRASAVGLGDPGPDEAALAVMLSAAMRAPDHGRLRPWRFIVLRGSARNAFGEVLAQALKRREPAAPDGAIGAERAKPLRAPLLLVAVAQIVDSPKIPAVEQILAAGAATQNIMLAAHAMGFGAMWRTGAPAYDDEVKRALGLGTSDQIVGFIYLGTPNRTATAVARPTVEAHVREWHGPDAATGN